MILTQEDKLFLSGVSLSSTKREIKTASSHDEAKKLGYTRYYGLPCKRGHVGVRNTYNRRCVECNREQQQAKRNHSRSGEAIA